MTAVTSHDPKTGEPASTAEETASEQVAELVEVAAGAARAVAATTPSQRRDWLRSLADALEAHQDELVHLADRETALGSTRLSGELVRAANQLRFYGDVAVEGSYLGVSIDEATATTPHLVRVNQPLGPVAVFGASNFPFAFGVLGNDIGAAIAAGCPVVVKAHPAHVGLSHRVAELAVAALTAAGAPPGAFGLVNGHQAGVDLVTAAGVSAVAFTGSQAGGLALWRIANDREVVIPVYAEMGTVNPVVLTRDGAGGDLAAVAAGLVGSFTLGNGQFCTKPGLMLAPAGFGAPEAVAAALRDAAPAPVMLTESIASSVRDGLAAMQNAGAEAVELLEAGGTGWAAPAAVLRADVSALQHGGRLLEECFGAVLLVCEYDDDQQLEDALSTLQGTLAASLITGGAADTQAAEVLGSLSEKAGRVVVDDWPTGVAFTWAQQHGGPWPSTSVPSATSVGAHALGRFVRPVAYQSANDAWLPPAGQAANPWRLPRRVNGALEHDAGAPR